MSGKKLKKLDGQLSVDDLFRSKSTGDIPLTPPISASLTETENPYYTPTPEEKGKTESKKRKKERSPPSIEKPSNKKQYLGRDNKMSTNNDNSTVTQPTQPIIQEGTDTIKHSKDATKNSKSIDDDIRFRDFSEEFRAFRKAMCEKVQEIVKPLKSNKETLQELKEPLNKDIKTLLDTKEKQDSNTELCQEIKHDHINLRKKCEEIETENRDLKTRLKKLENKMLEKNLITHGIREDAWELDDNRREKVYKMIAHTVDEKDTKKRLNTARRIPICSTRRIGMHRPGVSRPISVSFEKLTHAETLFQNKSFLPQGIYMDKEFTEETEKAQRVLRPILRLAKTLPEYKGKSKMEADTLIIQGKRYTTSNLHTLPTEINGFEASTKTNPNIMAFFGELNPFSNFHPAKFEINRHSYSCTEQYIQEQKVLFFKDTVTTREIMSTKDPHQCKQLARGLSGYNHENWNEVSKEICKPGIRAKFTQNITLSNLLLSTGDKTIVEACYDQHWGTGIPLKDKNCLKKESWTGTGIMGEILMEIRNELREIPMDTNVNENVST